MTINIAEFKNGMKDAVPISLGYIAVSFSFGIKAREAGVMIDQAVIMSATNFTSAGQFAALNIILVSAPFLEMAITQLIINLRYCLMSSALSQKIEKGTPFYHRFFIAAGVTDEIFGISIYRKNMLNPYYSYGAMSVALPGWAFGTFLGALSGELLPANVLSALGIALYGMFIAIIIPPSKGNKVLTTVLIVSSAASLLFTLMPFLNNISSGMRIIILTIIISGIAAYICPVKESQNEV